MWDGTASIADCQFVGNTAGVHGGAVWADPTDASPPMLQNCTFSANVAAQFAGGVYSPASGTVLSNCILWGNRGAGGSGIGETAQVKGDTPDVDYCCIEGWTGQLGGLGNIGEDPLFADAAGPDGVPGTLDDDLHLSADSPGIEAGDPGFAAPPGRTDLDGRMRCWDGDGDDAQRVDMGAHEFGSFVYADLNCDGQVNAFDIDPFVLALTDPPGYAAQFPACELTLGDTSADGKVDAFDIDPFVKRLTGR